MSTPPPLRYRFVTVLAWLFIGMTGFATLIGGVGTLLVVGLWMAMFPTLRRRQRLHDEPEPMAEPAVDTV